MSLSNILVEGYLYRIEKNLLWKAAALLQKWHNKFGCRFNLSSACFDIFFCSLWNSQNKKKIESRDFPFYALLKSYITIEVHNESMLRLSNSN